jgi:hypothetical protein
VSVQTLEPTQSEEDRKMLRNRLAGAVRVVLLVVMLSVPAWATFDYQEAISGDLSNSGMAPTVVVPGPGANYITGEVGGWGTDDDFFVITVPEALRFEGIVLLLHSSESNPSYLGMEDDAVFVTGLGNPNYFGYCYFDALEIGVDLLPILGDSNDNFEPPLGAGTYCFWVDEGGAWEDYSFQFVFRAYGDLNCDDVINVFDIDPYVRALTDPAAYEAAYPDCDYELADTNHDDVVDTFDIDSFVLLLTGGN